MKTEDIKRMGQLFKQVVDEALSQKQKELDVDNDGDIEADDLADLRKGKKKEESKHKKTEGTLPPALQKAIDKKKGKESDEDEDEDEDEDDLDEAVFSAKEIKMAIGVASDKRYAGGNYTGAVNAIEKIKKGLSNHRQVAAVLRAKNEEVVTESVNLKEVEAQLELSSRGKMNAMVQAYKQVWEASFTPKIGNDASLSPDVKKSPEGGNEATRDGYDKIVKERSKGEADFVAKHTTDVIDGEKIEADSIDKMKKDGKKSPANKGDKSDGDNNIINPVKDTTKT